MRAETQNNVDAIEKSLKLLAQRMDLETAPHRLEALGLQKSYGARKVVKDVRLAVDSGEVVGLLGPNGAGKTTSFRMTTGQITPFSGKVIFNGEWFH